MAAIKEKIFFCDFFLFVTLVKQKIFTSEDISKFKFICLHVKFCCR